MNLIFSFCLTRLSQKIPNLQCVQQNGLIWWWLHDLMGGNLVLPEHRSYMDTRTSVGVSFWSADIKTQQGLVPLRQEQKHSMLYIHKHEVRTYLRQQWEEKRHYCMTHTCSVKHSLHCCCCTSRTRSLPWKPQQIQQQKMMFFIS